MSLNYDYSREIYLLFHDDSKYFGSRFVKKGFKHVFAMERQSLGWTCVDPSRSDFIAAILPAGYQSEPIGQLLADNTGTTALGLEVLVTSRANYPRLGVLSCVGVMQYMLGVYWPHILTPYRLYNKLIASPPTHIRVYHVRR